MNEATAIGSVEALIAVDLPAILTRFGDTAPRWRPGERLEHLFEAVADAQPDAVAVETADRTLTFAELEAEANRLATVLRDRGLGGGDAIALLFGRTVEAYIALLAVLKIGAAYVPIDLAYPAERASYIASDAGCCAVVTISEHAELAAATSLPVLSLDTLAGDRRRSVAARVAAGEDAGDLAYLIYTSGSTGRPKGVRTSHRSIVNFVRVAVETYGYQRGDRVYQGLTLAFDFSVEEILVPLVAGATLVPSESSSALVGAELGAFLLDRRITALCCVPTLLETLEQALPDLRLLIVSGEACPDQLASRWHRPGRRILNAYGPTEITVTATVAVLEPGAPVNLGLPLPSYSIVILDPERPKALGTGALGEIGVAGIGLSPGYVGRDDLTAKVFVEDFLGLPDNPSQRIYRTGDLGCINESGQLEYHGRIDTQVKVRGFRIELTEIESAILQQPGVHQAVVGKFEPEPGLVELVAYYAAEPPVPPEDLADALRMVLPTYMLPAYYEPVPAIAMMASGKADRTALPSPSGARHVRRTAAYVAPVGEVEKRLATTLCDLLKLEQVSATHNFFDDLGANSLLMARFSTRIRAAIVGAEVSMRDIYLAPSVRKLASRLGERRVGSPVAAAPAPTGVPHVASDLAYWGTGIYQLLTVFFLVWASVKLLGYGFAWVRAETIAETYSRAVVFGAAVALGLFLIPIVAKWLLIGRWRETSFPIWGSTYARFWTVKVLIKTSPFSFMHGTPVYNAFLKALGARIAWSALVLSPPPICTDLFEVGPQTVVGRGVHASSYKALGGRILTGSVVIGARAFVGSGSVLDIRTRMEDDTELAHASSLHEGQRVEAGASYHGSPAEPAAERFRGLEVTGSSLTRRVAYTAGQLGVWIFVYAPLLVALETLVVDRNEASAGFHAWMPQDTIDALPWLLGWATLGYLGSILLGLAIIAVLPRICWTVLRAGKTYPLFGLRYLMFKMISGSSNSKFFNLMFGDSSFIVHYLRLVGYRFPGLQQTGSNFGAEFRHDVPFLCEFGSGTMISDGVIFANAEFSNAAFRLGWTRFGADSFVGNRIVFTPASRTGNNVMFGTKTLVPVHGGLREDVGLLGSPAFEIPRSVAVEPHLARFSDPNVIAEGLRGKNRYNLATIVIFLAVRLGWVALATVLAHSMLLGLGATNAVGLTLTILALWMVSLFYAVLFERAFMHFRPLAPRTCSIYEPYFWWHERYWKFLVDRHLLVLRDTPFMPLLWRSLGCRVGRKVYDGGCHMPERTLVTIGDFCTMNAGATMQSHSLEDGIFRSDYIVVGRGVTFGVGAFAHYGTTIGDGVLLDTNCFLMKGEAPAAQSRWVGNPARPAAPGHPTMLEIVSVVGRTECERERIIVAAQANAAMEHGAAVDPVQQLA